MVVWYGMNLKSVYEAIGGNVETTQHIKSEAGTSAKVADPFSILNPTADMVLKYHPKPKTKAAKRRIRRNKRLKRK